MKEGLILSGKQSNCQHILTVHCIWIYKNINSYYTAIYNYQSLFKQSLNQGFMILIDHAMGLNTLSFFLILKNFLNKLWPI